VTYAQVYYWRQLCAAVRARDTTGMPDDAWPPELRPSRSTSKALVQYGLLVRRKRAWHLKRAWDARLRELRQHAVVTLSQPTTKECPGPGLPSYAELERWEVICRWLDGQPKRRAVLPFAELTTFAAGPGMPEAASALTAVPIAELMAMRAWRVVRLTSTCEWGLSPSWQERLQSLWDGMPRSARARRCTSPDLSSVVSSPARVLASGLDTWYLNRLEAEALPARLRRRLDVLQERAKDEDEEVETPWSFDGAPLCMYRAGVNTAQGGGVSWSYILRNASLALLIRRHPLGSVIAQARLGSECLWRLTDLRALNELDAVIRRMWGKTEGRWQVSQAHLAVDLAHAPLQAEQLERFVSRSRRQAIYEAARADVERLTYDLYGEGEADVLALTVDWDAQYADASDALVGWDPFGLDGDAGMGQVSDEPEPVEDRAIVQFRAHRRLSGVTFSPGGAISLVLYDKRLQGVVSGKRHMEPIWQASAGGWRAEEGATRVEARLRREAVRELGLPAERRSCLDDLWEFLQHKQDVFAAVVGLPEDGTHGQDGCTDGCPDGTNTSWIRLVVPDLHDRNRSRWPTDPAWRVVQSAPFSPAPAAARRLIRRKQRLHDVARLDTGVYGYLVSRAAHLHADGGRLDVSAALSETRRALVKESAKPGKDFGELVRERRRRFGLPNQPAEKVLPFRPVPTPPEPREEALEERLFSAALDEAVPHERERDAERPLLLLRCAELRMQRALQELQAAEALGATSRRLSALERWYQDELAAYQAAYEHYHRLHPVS
jgi:hypothetical protein